MLVFKFGGASVKNAEAIRNIANILRKYSDKIVVVVSAMGKTTNALEQITSFYAGGKRAELDKAMENLKAYHYYIVNELFQSETHPLYGELKKVFARMEERLSEVPTLNYDFDYDQIVANGEILSTMIVAAYLKEAGVSCRWTDARQSIKTDNKYREARVEWELSEKLVKKNFEFEEDQVIITQGFIGSTINNLSTTLGREGSDYTAAILAYLLDAERVVIWKDVPGVLNADPKWFDNTVLLEQLSYQDAIELAYYGASVIHPKTIQPLKKKAIPLQVKSFLKPGDPGTLIGSDDYDSLIPSFIFKMDQVLISISPLDFSFIAEDNLELILGSFARHGLRINLMQNSAISFQVCVNNDKNRIGRVVSELQDHFDIQAENGLELATIRYFDQATIERVTLNKQIIIEQHNHTVAQMVMRDKAG
jgi:aspartate kinase